MITKIILENFRSHQRTELTDLARINIIRGPNGVGKTSVQLAFEYLLTGRCAVTDEAGRGAELLIAHGAKELRVSVELAIDGKEDACRISRSKSRAGGNVLVQPPAFMSDDLVGKHAEAWIEEHLAAKDVLCSVLNSNRFLDMSEKDQKALLLASLPAKRVDVPQEIQEAIITCGFAGSSTIGSAAEAESVYDKFYKQRAELNRQIKGLGELKEPVRPADIPDKSIDEIKVKLDEVRRERDKAVWNIGDRKTAHAASKQRLMSAREHLQSFKSDILSDEDLDKLRKVAGQTKRVTELEREITGLNGEIAKDRATVAQLKSAPGNCPACKRPLERTDATQQIEDLEQAITTRETLRNERRTVLNKLGDPATAEAKLNAHKKAVVSTEGAERTIKELANLPVEVDLRDLELELATVDERMRKGSDVLARVQGFEGECRQYHELLNLKDKLARQVEAADKVIKAFDPAGPIRAQLVGDRFESFAGSLNKSLARFGFECSFDLSNYDLRVSTSGDTHALKLNQLSESEAMRFGVAFQIALAEATEAPLVVIDRSDMLLPAVRPFLSAALITSNVRQVLILVAADTKLERIPEGVRFFDLAKTGEGITNIAASYGVEIREMTYAAE